MKTEDRYASRCDGPTKEVRKLTLEIVLHDHDAEQFEDAYCDVGQLIRDALGEFVATRQNVRGDGALHVKEYVEKRYAHMDQKFRLYKMREVAQRVRAATLLLRGEVSTLTEGKQS